MTLPKSVVEPHALTATQADIVWIAAYDAARYAIRLPHERALNYADAVMAALIEEGAA